MSLVATCDDATEGLLLCLMVARAAGLCEFEELAYDFYVDALTIFEDNISGSRQQSQAIAIIVGSLHASRAFNHDNYDTLVTKISVYAAKLLKRIHQALGVQVASHLWWQVRPNNKFSRARTSHVSESLDVSSARKKCCTGSFAE